MSDPGAVIRGPSSFRLNSADPLAVVKMRQMLQALLSDLYRPYIHQLIVLCLGTDRSTGDALGPLAGSKLRRWQPERTVVIGTLEEPVHAINLALTVETINRHYSFPLIIAVDACLGRAESVGSIELGLGPLRPGAGANKSLPGVGHIHVSGIVNTAGLLEYYVLQNTRLSLVARLAELIARGLYFGLREAASLPTPSRAEAPR